MKRFLRIKELVGSKATFLFPPRFVIILIAVGVFFRFERYLQNQAVRLDEAMRALEILRQSYGDLMLGSNFVYASPLGFSFLTKVSVGLFGNTEGAFRFLPLVAGLGSLFAYCHFLKKMARSEALLTSLSLFVFSGPLIHFSATVKQFSSDVFFVPVLFVLWDQVRGRERKIKASVLFVFCSSFAIWISWPSLFVLTSFLLLDLARCLRSRKHRAFPGELLAHGPWLMILAFVYFLSLRKRGDILGLVGMWKGTFWPWPPWSGISLIWLKDTFFSLFTNPVGLCFPLVGAVLFVVGVCAVYHYRKDLVVKFLLPVILTLGASLFKLYPFQGRALLFIVPLFLFFIGEGLGWFLRKKAGWRLVGCVALAFLLGPMIHNAVSEVFIPTGREEIRPLVRALKAYQQKGDDLYLNTSARYALQYYSQKYRYYPSGRLQGLLSDHIRQDAQGSFLLLMFPQRGVDSKLYLGEPLHSGWVHPEKFHLKRLPGGSRTWVLLSHYEPGVEKIFMDHLDRIGTRLIGIRKPGAVLYLYDLESRDQ